MSFSWVWGLSFLLPYLSRQKAKTMPRKATCTEGVLRYSTKQSTTATSRIGKAKAGGRDVRDRMQKMKREPYWIKELLRVMVV